MVNHLPSTEQPPDLLSKPLPHSLFVSLHTKLSTIYVPLSLKRDVGNKEDCKKKNDVTDAIKIMQHDTNILNATTACNHKSIHAKHLAEHQSLTDGESTDAHGHKSSGVESVS